MQTSTPLTSTPLAPSHVDGGHADTAHGDVAHADAGTDAGTHAHPTWSTYWKVAVVLTAITALEVWIYYIPSFVASRLFVPTLLVLSAVKFAIVVMFYMHLRYDSKLFRALFTGPLMVAIITVVALLFLFGQVSIPRPG